MTTTTATILLPETPVRETAQESAAATMVVVTWAESCECTCPEVCDRDHEQD